LDDQVRDLCVAFFFSSRRRHTRFKCDWSSDVCSSDLSVAGRIPPAVRYILGNEACERFSFYGMSTILVTYMQQYLTWPRERAERSEERRVGKEWRCRRWTEK